MNRRKDLVVLLTLLMLSTATAIADEGRIPVFRQTTIATPGHYILTRDIAVTGGVALNITADGVTLDLNGHTLSSSSTTEDLIQISGCGTKGFIIEGGKLQGGRVGIHALPPGPCKLTVHDVTIGDPNVVGDPNIKGIFVEHTGQIAIRGIVINWTPSPGAVAIELSVPLTTPASPAGLAEISGIIIDGGKGIKLTRVVGHLSDGLFSDPSGETSIDLVEASGSSIYGIIIEGGLQAGPQPHLRLIRSSGVRIEGCTLHGGAGGSRVPLNDGLFMGPLSDNAMILDNTITGMGGDGIHIESQGSFVKGNLVNGGGSAGIFIGGANNLIESNKVAGNGQYGLYFDTSTGPHVFRGNVLRGQPTPLGGPGATGATDGGGNIQ